MTESSAIFSQPVRADDPLFALKPQLRNDLLLAAATRGRTGRCQQLLRAGADPELADDLGCTPLHRAIFAENLATVNVLLEHNAGIERRVGGTGTSCTWSTMTPLLSEYSAAFTIVSQR